MRAVLVIQARMGSTRLPGKSLMDLAGAPLVGRILERVLRCRQVDEIVLAVPTGDRDEPLAKLARDYGVTAFRGSESDVLERYVLAARAARAGLVGRLPADNATPEPGEIDRIFDFHRRLGRRGFSTNLAQALGSGYPDGIGAEVVDMSLLEEAHAGAATARQREHVHLNFFDYGTQQPVNPAWCPVAAPPCPPEFRRPDVVLDVNTMEQYEFLRRLYEYLYPRNPAFHITDVIRWVDTVYRPAQKPV